MLKLEKKRSYIPKKHEEEDNQIAFFRYLYFKHRNLIDLKKVYAIPNGGYRKKSEAQRLKLAGVTPGVFDINIDVPVAPWHGMKIELKVGKNRLTPEQKEFKRSMENDYLCVVCYTWHDAIKQLLNYLKDTHYLRDIRSKLDHGI